MIPVMRRSRRPSTLPILCTKILSADLPLSEDILEYLLDPQSSSSRTEAEPLFRQSDIFGIQPGPMNPHPAKGKETGTGIAIASGNEIKIDGEAGMLPKSSTTMSRQWATRLATALVDGVTITAHLAQWVLHLQAPLSSNVGDGIP
jgi:hypothetical protein